MNSKPKRKKVVSSIDPDELLAMLKEHLSIEMRMGTDFTNPNDLEVKVMFDREVVCSTTTHISISREYEG